MRRRNRVRPGSRYIQSNGRWWTGHTEQTVRVIRTVNILMVYYVILFTLLVVRWSYKTCRDWLGTFNNRIRSSKETAFVVRRSRGWFRETGGTRNGPRTLPDNRRVRHCRGYRNPAFRSDDCVQDVMCLISLQCENILEGSLEGSFETTS